MNFARAQPIADAILYEGYVLYPYRPSSLKNRHPFTFGTLCPASHGEDRGGFEPSRFSCAFLIEAGADAEIAVQVRFLELLSAGLGQAAPRQTTTDPLRLEDLLARSHRHSFSGEVDRDPRVEGALDLEAARVGEGVYRLTVRVSNLTEIPRSAAKEEVQIRSLASAHALVGVRGGAFVSMLDPPDALRAPAEACRSAGAWPILVGDPGARELLLCSPIILADYPAIAPESPGDLFDGTEIDEMLALRILTLAPAEREEAAAVDPRVRAILERTEALSPEALARLHGATRRTRAVLASGAEVAPGDRVRLHPRGRADALDLAFEGRAATVASIEEDLEHRIFVTVTVDDDPGRDLGADGKPGHRFFFRPDEVEAIAEGRR